MKSLRDFAYYALLVASGMATFWLVYDAGKASTAQLAADAFAREAHRAELLPLLVDRATRAMSFVLREDPYLHSRVMGEVPDWYEVVGAVRAWEVTP